MWCVLDLVQRFGGGRTAQALAGLAMLVSVAWLRAFSMLQPVPFDICFWGVLSLLLTRCLADNSEHRLQNWALLGLVAGLALLNKYTIVFWGVTALGGVLLSPGRRVFFTAGPYLAAALALVVLSPNLWWQYEQGFPVVAHMRELSAHQLVNVEPGNFLKGQLLFHASAVFVWLPGLFYLLRAPHLRVYRALGWQLPLLLALLLALHGKDYYALGAYPALFAAGAVAWEKWLRSTWARATFAGLLLLLALPLVPAGLPVLPAPALERYTRWTEDGLGIDGLARWEDGRRHALPQDYADMLGWPELGALADEALRQAGAADSCMVYAENYGQAGAVERFAFRSPEWTAQGNSAPPVVSFADAYRLWTPDTLPARLQTLIYINDELGEDVQNLFADIRSIGQIRDTLAREYGTQLWLCRSSRQDLPAFWAERVRAVKSGH